MHRKRTLTAVAAALVTTITLAASAAEAYEKDTHFYDTYAMAREAGFKHEYARYLALAAEWVDKGASSTPMGGLVLGTMLRRVWHFPGYRFKTTVASHGRGKFKPISIATFNHPVAHKLFDEGMRQSNWMKIGLSIHTVQDSAGHSGYSDVAGHAEFGHNPDRTWLAPKKYKRMTGLVFKQLVALRAVAPDEALEPKALQERAVRRQNNTGVTEQDHIKLQESFWKKFGGLVSKDYFKDARYTPEAVNQTLRLAKKNGFIKETRTFKLEQNLPTAKDYQLPGDRKNARQVLEEWVTTRRAAEIQAGVLSRGSIFNLKAAMDAAGYKDVRLQLERLEQKEKNVARRIAAYKKIVTPEITKDVIKGTVDNFTRGVIPRILDGNAYVNVIFEGEDGPRKIEKQLKEKDRQAAIKKYYGVALKFSKKADYFSRKDRIAAILVKWGHNLRTIGRDLLRRGVKAHTRVKGYQSTPVLNEKIHSGVYPQMGPLSKRSIFGRSRLPRRRAARRRW